MAIVITRIRDNFRQLRWKLTFSYTAVTVGTLLIVVLVLALLIFPRVLTPSGVVTPEMWITATNEQVVPVFYGALIQSPPDQDLIRRLLVNTERIGATITSQDFLQIGQIELMAKATAEVDFVLLDSSGALLGTSHRGLVPLVEYGQPFDEEAVPGLAGPLQAALEGQTDPQRLFSVIEPDEEFIWAVPVIGAGNRQGELLGAIIVRLDSFPSSGDLAAHTIILISRGLLVIVLAAGVIGGLFGSLTAEGMVSRFDRLWSVTTAWSQGDFSRFVHDASGDEISQLARRLNTMAVQLRELLVSRQQIAVTQERNRLARDLHDSAKQQALAASFQLGTAQTLLDQDDIPGVRRHLIEAENLIDSVRLELTDLIHELRPPEHDQRKLDESVGDYAVEWAHQNQVRLNLELEPGVVLAPEVHKTLYRIVQEALANVARHSGATAAIVRLWQAPGSTTLEIEDDGCGFDPDDQHDGVGLRSMRERAVNLDGTMCVTSEPGEGTLISITIPTGTDQKEEG
jgi:signal transduction histidine kinase